MRGGADLVVRNLRKVFGDNTAVDDVSFSVGAGESVGLVGESGSGKTTIARMIYGLETPSSGSITVGGVDRAHAIRRAERRSRARDVQMVFQNPYGSLDRRQTVRSCLGEVLAYHMGHLGRAQRAARVEELLSVVGLTAREGDAHPRRLSGGQRQRVAIARSLAVEPSMLLLDEPVSALDVSIQAQILNLLLDIQESTGISYLLISHDLAVIRQMTTRCLVLYRGQVVEEGTTDSVLSNPVDPYTQRLKASVPRAGWKPQAVSAMSAGHKAEGSNASH